MDLKRTRRLTTALLTAAMLLALPAGAGWAAPAAEAPTEESGAAETPAVPDTKPTPAPEPARPPKAPPDELPPVPEPKLTKEDALARLREVFVLPAETERTRIDGNLSQRAGHPTWEFMYMVFEENGSSGMSIASVDAVTGQILNFNKAYIMGQPVPTGPMAQIGPEAKAQEKALALVKQLYPDALAGMKLADRPTAEYMPYYYGPYGTGAMDAYTFVWQQDVNGVPYPASRIDVSLDKQTLDVVSFSANLAEGVHFAEGPAELSAAEALQRYQELVTPQLTYQPEYAPYPFGGARPGAMLLVYTFGMAGRQLDAMTGEFSDAGLFGMPAAGDPEPVPAGTGAVVKPAVLPLTDAAAVSLGTMLLSPPEGIRVQTDSNPYADTEQVQVGWFSPRGGGSASAALDRKTGLIRYAYRSVPAEMPKMETGSGMTVVSSPATPAPAPGTDAGRPAGPTPEQKARAREAAIRVIQSFYSQFVGNLLLLPTPDPMPMEEPNSLNFTFQRYVNGIPVSGSAINIRIDLRTMDWQSINANWIDGVTFPDPSGAISAAEASAIFYKDRKAVLTYEPVRRPQLPGQWENPQAATEAHLVYSLQGAMPPVLDAMTGQPFMFGGKPGTDPAQALESIRGHWAENELRYAVRTGAIQADKLNPDAAISRMEAVYMLLGSRRLIRVDSWQAVKVPYTDVAADTSAYAIVASAWRQGWLKPADGEAFRPDAPITRAEFVVWAARILGLGDLARSGLKTEPAYADMQGLTAEQQNAAAFLRGLGLLSPGETFRGADPLTQAEAASLSVRLYNYLIAH